MRDVSEGSGSLGFSRLPKANRLEMTFWFSMWHLSSFFLCGSLSQHESSGLRGIWCLSLSVAFGLRNHRTRHRPSHLLGLLLPQGEAVPKTKARLKQRISCSTCHQAVPIEATTQRFLALLDGCSDRIKTSVRLVALSDGGERKVFWERPTRLCVRAISWPGEAQICMHHFPAFP